MPAYYDEAYEAGGEPRPQYRAVLEALHNHDLAKLGADDFALALLGAQDLVVFGDEGFEL